MQTILNQSAWWLKSLKETLESLDVKTSGLDSEEVEKRRKQFGANQFVDHKEKPIWKQLLVRFRNPLILLLLFASVISAFMGEISNFIIISILVLFSVLLDFIQEHKAGKAADSLRHSVSVQATVVRDGNIINIPVSQVVPGDLVLLSAGDLVPADGRVLETNDFFVKQSLLTGETYPVEKHPGELKELSNDITDASNAVFMGTTVISGSAKVLIVNTGANTAMGAISDSLAIKPPQNSFELGTQKFGILILRMTVLLVLFVLLVNAILHKPWLDSFLFAVALAVGLTPELLPMVISVTLSRGALMMAKKRVIVKQLSSIQNLGSMDTLCTDKTGTLTEAKIKLERHIDLTGEPSDRVLELAYLNSFFETGLKSPLDEAILEHEEIDVSLWNKIDEVPFDFERRRVSVLLDHSEKKKRILVVKGAPEEIIKLCTHFETEKGTIQLIDLEAKEKIHSVYTSLEKQGFRVLGIAWREETKELTHAVKGDESELILSGFAAFLDPPKESARLALSSLNEIGITVKIITGDSELVTQHVCSELKMPVLGVLTGKEIDSIDDSALSFKVESTNLFCRMNPSQKNRIILALKHRGHVVGYLGDGVNDAPSLHSADVGLSVDSGVDVAKEAAGMILLDHDLSVLYEGVMEGRRTFGNIMKYIMMGTSSNFGNMFSMAGAALFLPFLPMLPTQILLNNFLYDISEIPIPLDEVDKEELKIPRVMDITFIRNFMLTIGPISSVFDFLTFYVMLVVLKTNETLFQTGWFVESLCTQVLVIFIIRTRGNPIKSRPHRLLAIVSISIAAIGAILPFTQLGTYFGLVPPPMEFYAILASMVVIYLFVVETAKRIFYRFHSRK
ncbi:magnesium-translocating P-type ATPase [Leptospira terpstrae]|uniref:Magnesium-transporting ATPase, P-type 1 n=1 Tax=Leptospira terpstrae serovar Hualin str. LT 11-33 = ATCC 700639 TaxID=1257025 RepID=N1VT15_9LEPT|nr:magnesium-translocating P-type ATPase [Leptospira terpstrae]EMY60165.1 magnesium-importing ATPase [Leptospira terpstrae serovar Hualin str. LT 11-33 = ATCC 700639]